MCAKHKNELTCIEENFGAVIMLPRTGYMKRRPIVAVMGLHESSLINHELNTIWITYCERQGKLCLLRTKRNALQLSVFPNKAEGKTPMRQGVTFEIEMLHPKLCLWVSNTQFLWAIKRLQNVCSFIPEGLLKLLSAWIHFGWSFTLKFSP